MPVGGNGQSRLLARLALEAVITYSLCVNLTDVGKPLGQNVGGHLVAKLVSKLGRFALRSLGEGSGIGDRASDDAPY